MKKYIDLSKLPRSNTGKSILWGKSTGYVVDFIYDDIEGSMTILEYNSKNRKLKVNYLNKEYYIQTSNFANCVLGTIVGKICRDYIYEIGTIFQDDKRDYIIIDREIRKDKSNADRRWYFIKCNKCTYAYWCCEKSIKSNCGCSCCANKVAVLGINTIWDTDRWMVDLGVSEEDAKRYTKCSSRKIEVVCPYCKNIRTKNISDIYNKKSIGCACGDGKTFPEKFIYNVLTQLKVDFKIEYSPSYLKRKEGDKLSQKRSDFYIPSLNLVIEADGGMNHKGGKTHANAKRSIEEYIEIDKWKDEQHKLHGTETIRIDCLKSEMDYIKNNIYASNLSKYFNLDKVNWLESFEFAWKNNTRYEVCQYWNTKNEDESSGDLAKIFGLSKGTINNYLKYGNKLNWCVYNTKDELRKVKLYKDNTNARMVEVFKEGKSCGVFQSVPELCRVSMDVFGVNFNYEGVYSVCSKRRKKNIYKGFEFEYV